MDQSLLNFWKNYEDVINWGYRISGAQEIERSAVSGYTKPLVTKKQVFIYGFFKLFTFNYSEERKL